MMNMDNNIKIVTGGGIGSCDENLRRTPRPAWGKGVVGVPAVASRKTTLNDIMSEQYIEAEANKSNPQGQANNMETPTQMTTEADEALERVLELSRKEYNQEEHRLSSKSAVEKVAEDVHAVHRVESGDASFMDKDYALALQLQEFEQTQYQSYQNGVKALHQRQQIGQKVTVSYRNESSLNDDESLLSKYMQLGLSTKFEEPLDQDNNTEKYDSNDPLINSGRYTFHTDRRKPNWPVRNKQLKGQGGTQEIVTKHDALINGHKNISRLFDNDKIEFNTGDLRNEVDGKKNSIETEVATGILMSNYVYNSLQRKVKKQTGVEKGLTKTVEKDFYQTYSKGIDHKTRLNLQSLINSGLLNDIQGVIKGGKEAFVLYALSGPKSLWPEEILSFIQQFSDSSTNIIELALKVLKTTLNEFKSRVDYVKGDHRFADLALSKQNPRKIIKIWAEKEFKNLVRIHRAGIPSPMPIKLSKNVIVMSFLGYKSWAAPQLKMTDLSLEEYYSCYFQCCLLLRGLYEKCELVHADFSEYNIIYFEGICFVIDVGQAVLIHHPDGDNFLKRDCGNLIDYFSKKGLEKILKAEDLTKFVKTGRVNKAVVTVADENCDHEKVNKMLQTCLDKLKWATDLNCHAPDLIQT